MISLFLNHIISPILELHSCITREQWRKFILTLSASLCTSVRHGARVKCLIKISILLILCVNFAPLLRLFVFKLFCSNIYTLLLFLVLRFAEIVNIMTGNLSS